MKLQSLQNEKIKQYQKLRSFKKYRDETGLFCLEGFRLIEDAFENGAVLIAVFAASFCFERYRAFLTKCEKVSPVYEMDDRLLSKLSDVEHSQGLLAIARKPVKEAKEGHRVVLCELQDPGNVGSILRSADAFGIAAVHLYRCCDLYNPKTVRASMGAIFHLPCYPVEDMTSLMKDFKVHHIQTVASVLDSKAVLLSKMDFTKKTALLIGNEGNGLNEDIVKKCDRSCTIPMQGRAESLNAAAAAAVTLYSMSQSAEGSNEEKERKGGKPI